MPPVQCLITIYVNYALPSCCKTIYMWIIQCYLVAKALYMWIIQCNAMLFSQIMIYVNYIMLSFFVLRVPFVDNVCIFNYSSCASAIWSGDGSIWSENKVFRADNATCWSRHLAGYSSSEEDSETNDQSYFPPEVYAQTWQGYISHIMHMVSYIAMPSA